MLPEKRKELEERRRRLQITHKVEEKLRRYFDKDIQVVLKELRLLGIDFRLVYLGSPLVEPIEYGIYQNDVHTLLNSHGYAFDMEQILCSLPLTIEVFNRFPLYLHTSRPTIVLSSFLEGISGLNFQKSIFLDALKDRGVTLEKEVAIIWCSNYPLTIQMSFDDLLSCIELLVSIYEINPITWVFDLSGRWCLELREEGAYSFGLLSYK